MNEAVISDHGDYRGQLITYYVKSQDDFDKTLIALAGGALGISFAFVDGFVDPSSPQAVWSLSWSWILWSLCLVFVLCSFFASNLAARKALKQLDDGTIYNKRTGGSANWITAALNIVGGCSFVVGVFLMIYFVIQNLEVR